MHTLAFSPEYLTIYVTCVVHQVNDMCNDVYNFNFSQIKINL